MALPTKPQEAQMLLNPAARLGSDGMYRRSQVARPTVEFVRSNVHCALHSAIGGVRASQYGEFSLAGKPIPF